jgi:tripartite-type tricarboxylate transporter receptor subunit TctC
VPSHPKTLVAAVLLSVAGLVAPAAHAQSTAQAFPSKPIRFVVPFGPGTSTDQGARYIGQRLSELVHQPVVIDNRPGANGYIAMQSVLSQPADGYTLAYGTNTTHAANVSMFKNVPYDAVKDFVGISGIAIGGGAIVVAPGFPAKNIPELVALAKQNPGKYTFGSSSSFARMGIETLKHAAGIDLLHVPYKGSAPNVVEVMAGTVDMTFDPLITMISLIRAGKVRALGVSTQRRVPGLEEIPTVAEQGFPGYQFLAWQALFAPANTPPEIVKQLNALIVSILKTSAAADFFRQAAMWETMPMSTTELAAFVAAETEHWRTIVKQAGIEMQ